MSEVLGLRVTFHGVDQHLGQLTLTLSSLVLLEGITIFGGSSTQILDCPSVLIAFAGLGPIEAQRLVVIVIGRGHDVLFALCGCEFGTGLLLPKLVVALLERYVSEQLAIGLTLLVGEHNISRVELAQFVGTILNGG